MAARGAAAKRGGWARCEQRPRRHRRAEPASPRHTPSPRYSDQREAGPTGALRRGAPTKLTSPKARTQRGGSDEGDGRRGGTGATGCWRGLQRRRPPAVQSSKRERRPPPRLPEPATAMPRACCCALPGSAYAADRHLKRIAMFSEHMSLSVQLAERHQRAAHGPRKGNASKSRLLCIPSLRCDNARCGCRAWLVSTPILFSLPSPPSVQPEASPPAAQCTNDRIFSMHGGEYPRNS
jgi:hypothetical protein